MGTIVNGANGGFKGKAGSVIGSSWKGINYIKGLYKKRTKPASEAQLQQQAKFGLLMRFLLPIRKFINIGFGRKNMNKAVPGNVALQFNFAEGITGVYPDYVIDYSKIRISDGTLYGAGNVTVSYDQGDLTLNWDTAVNEDLENQLDDVLYVVGYHPEKDEFVTNPTRLTRADGTVTFPIPGHLQSGVLHIWYFMSDRKKLRVSKSSYLGELQLD